jgi:rare lipoprotein A
MAPYQVNGVWYRPRAQPDYDAVGVATWYGGQYHHRRTADGEIFEMDKASAAHATLPLPCIVEVTNLDNGRRIQVRVNDRGPFVAGRILDLSQEGARELGFYERGSARVRVRYIGPAPGETQRLVRVTFSPPAPAFAAPPVPSVQGSSVQVSSLPASPPPADIAPAAAPQVQAGAFAERANAERAAARLEGVGAASITPLDRGGARLWRVTVSGAPGESLQALRDQVIAAGFSLR